jgi:hypothetical protein
MSSQLKYSLISRNKAVVVALMMVVLLIGVAPSLSCEARSNHSIEKISFRPSDEDVSIFALRPSGISKEIKSTQHDVCFGQAGGERVNQIAAANFLYVFGHRTEGFLNSNSRFLLLCIIRR